MKKISIELGEDLDDDKLNDIFHRADLDDDGFITFEDFYNVMTHKVYWEQ